MKLLQDQTIKSKFKYCAVKECFLSSNFLGSGYYLIVVVDGLCTVYSQKKFKAPLFSLEIRPILLFIYHRIMIMPQEVLQTSRLSEYL